MVRARRAIGTREVVVQTELGDVALRLTEVIEPAPAPEVVESLRNTGTELFKVKQPDYLGEAQWAVMRGGRAVRARILHRDWLLRWRAREFEIGPGDSLRARFEETVSYDQLGNEIDRDLVLIEVLGVDRAPRQRGFTAPGYLG